MVVEWMQRVMISTRPDDQTLADFPTRVRRRVCPSLHRIAQPIGGFAQCVMVTDEFVGIVDRELQRFTSDLESLGFRREPVSALKLHRDGRKSVGSWVKRSSVLAEKQLHVTLFARNATSIEVFAHWEYSWIRHPLRHYRASGWDTQTGVEMMRELLSSCGISLRSGPMT